MKNYLNQSFGDMVKRNLKLMHNTKDQNINKTDFTTQVY